jgi:hypothetical protein
MLATTLRTLKIAFRNGELCETDGTLHGKWPEPADDSLVCSGEILMDILAESIPALVPPVTALNTPSASVP